MASRKKLTQFNVIARITVGIVALIASLILLADVLFDVFPNDETVTRQTRTEFIQNLSIQLATLIEANDKKIINKTINKITTHNESVLSIGIRKPDGWLEYATSNHLKHWDLAPLAPSTVDYLRMPILSNDQAWGSIEVSFKTKSNNKILGSLNQRIYVLIGLIILSTLFIYLYLSRALYFLNPSKAVPSRVNTAFDIITDSILVLDKQGRVVLTNAAFKALTNIPEDKLYGKTIEEIHITKDLIKQLDNGDQPWTKPFTDFTFHTQLRDKKPLMLLASCAPVADDNKQSRGYLITLKNITELHETNQKLSETLQALKLSRAKLEINNEQLQEMAYRDSLTGCLNRRAFFQKAEDLYTLAWQGNREFYCVMADIDFFKSFNDIYGHYVGDQVIQIVAKILTSTLRPTDLICRYGGEEFCIVLSDVSQQQALDICERMRSTIEETANKSLRNDKVKQITASFGIASINSGARSIENLIDYADSALYISKESGRNQVNQWVSTMIK